MFTPLLALITILYSCEAQTLDKLCKGARYFKHPTDCDKFVQCRYGAPDRLVAYTRECAFPTYWNMELLTCVPFEKITCASDRCEGLPDGMVFRGNGNCRGYWECKNGKSEQKCCPLGKKFDDEFVCVETKLEDDECKDNCIDIIYDSQNDTSNITNDCKKEAVDGKPNYYKQFQLGWGMQIYPCAPGTVFDEEECECVRGDAPAQKAKCKPEIDLTFKTEQKMSNGYFIKSKNVLVKNGVGDFNGVNSRLSIPRFNNVEHSKALVIRVKYSSNRGESGYPQAILSNSGCEILPSIIITEDENAVSFGVGTTKTLMASVSVPQPMENMQTEKTVELKFLNGVLMGSVNNETAVIAAEGYLRNVQCPLDIGFADNALPFNGKISELTVFLCEPEI